MQNTEIRMDGVKKKTGARQRYTSMKKYFSYINNVNPACTMPCVVYFEGEKYISFTNGISVALTTESTGEMKLFEHPDKYPKVEKVFTFDGEGEEIDFNTIIAEAKSRGYKLKKSEVEPSGDFKYILHYDGAYFKLGLLDATYSIINNGEKTTVWHVGARKECSPIIIKNSIGVCAVLPFHYYKEKSGATVIEVA